MQAIERVVYGIMPRLEADESGRGFVQECEIRRDSVGNGTIASEVFWQKTEEHGRVEVRGLYGSTWW